MKRPRRVVACSSGRRRSAARRREASRRWRGRRALEPSASTSGWEATAGERTSSSALPVRLRAPAGTLDDSASTSGRSTRGPAAARRSAQAELRDVCACRAPSPLETALHFPAMALPAEHDRNRAAASLRRHYLLGRLSVDELSDRLDLAFAARNQRELRQAFRGLPAPWSRSELAADDREHALRGQADAPVRRAGRLLVGHEPDAPRGVHRRRRRRRLGRRACDRPGDLGGRDARSSGARGSAARRASGSTPSSGQPTDTYSSIRATVRRSRGSGTGRSSRPCA